MTNRLDARQLDQVWDAIVLGRPFPLLVEDPEELQLLGLLVDVDRPAPNSAFLRSLEEKLTPATPPLAASAIPKSLPARKLPAMGQPSRTRVRPPDRSSLPAYASAAVALLLIFSTVFIALPRFGSESERSIPAVSGWLDDGPPSSGGVQSKTLFAHTLTPTELASFGSDQWGWSEFSRSTAIPGERLASMSGNLLSLTKGNRSVVVVEVETGSLEVILKGPALLLNEASGISEHITGPIEVRLNAGDALMFELDALGQIWNPTTETSIYVSGGLYIDPTTPFFSFIDGIVKRHSGISIDPLALSQDTSLELSLKKVTIDPNQTFAYTTVPHMLLLADINGEGLTKQHWISSQKDGKAQTLVSSSYWLQSDSDGYYTLTNTSDQQVEVYLFGVTPTTESPASAPPSATVRALFSQTLSLNELAAYQSDQWNWISISAGNMAPGDQAIITTGSPIAGDVGFTGLGAITVTSGTLDANAAQGATVQRGEAGPLEPVDRSKNVTLNVGDTLIVPANTLPAVWNTSDADATYLTGGVYTMSNITPMNEMDFDFTRSGITVHPEDLATGAPVTMTLQQITIPPRASYAFTVTPATWLEAIVSGGELREQQSIDGTPQGKPRTLQESTYSLHSDGPGDYLLTNDGTETVEISFYRVEAQGSAQATASPVPSEASEHEQSAN